MVGRLRLVWVIDSRSLSIFKITYGSLSTVEREATFACGIVMGESCKECIARTTTLANTKGPIDVVYLP